MNKKLRLVVTAECHNKCPMCCNNRLDLSELPVVDRWDYDEIMITGGEPSLFSQETLELIESIRTLHKVSGWDSKIFVYTAIASAWQTCDIILASDGIVATPHTEADLKRFCELNAMLLRQRYVTEGKSLRLNLFPEVKKLLPHDMDLSLWKIKEMQWIKDCPVPDGEDLRRINELLKNDSNQETRLRVPTRPRQGD